MKNTFLIGSRMFFLLLVFSFSLNLVSSSQYSDCSIYGNCKPVTKINGGSVTNNNYYNITVVNGSSFNITYDSFTAINNQSIWNAINTSWNELRANSLYYKIGNLVLGNYNLSTNGFVGIGTSPSSNIKLDIHAGAVAGRTNLKLRGIDNEAVSVGINISDENEGTYFTVQSTGDSGLLGKVFIGGKTGIGTDSPSHKLNVVGDANITGTIFAGNGTGLPIIIRQGLQPQANVVAGNQIGAIEWYNNSFFVTDFKVRRTIVRGQDVLTQNKTIENTVTETEIFNLAHGADYLLKGKMEDIQIWGLLSSTTGVGDNKLNISIDYGGAHLGSFTTTEANRNDVNFELHILTTVTEPGATGKMWLHSNVDTSTDGTLGWINTHVTIDTTTQQNLTVTAKWSDASTANSLKILQGRALSIDDNLWN